MERLAPPAIAGDRPYMVAKGGVNATHGGRRKSQMQPPSTIDGYCRAHTIVPSPHSRHRLPPKFTAGVVFVTPAPTNQPCPSGCRWYLCYEQTRYMRYMYSYSNPNTATLRLDNEGECEWRVSHAVTMNAWRLAGKRGCEGKSKGVCLVWLHLEKQGATA